jgi:5,6-dimethylbenzimidazole synthase
MQRQPDFDETFRANLRSLLVWRRDVRRFSPQPLPDGTIEHLIELAGLSPSVGLSQPWRFVIVDDPGRRRGVLDQFKACNTAALKSFSGELAARYARLKLAGLEEAPCQIAVFTDRATLVGHGLGQSTMPETAEYSAVAAICTIWLAARAEGIGMGWISILDPARMAEILDVPATWHFVGYFCLGYPQSESDTPELEREDWERRRSATTYLLRR